MSDQTRRAPTLVLGGTGKTGRRVAERLTACRLSVRIGSRSGESRFDCEDRSTWAAALEGVGSVDVAHYADATPGAAWTLGAFVTAVENGVPHDVVEMLTCIFGEVLDGRNARLADDVPRALGREPRDFGDYARAVAATGIWNPAQVPAA